MKEEPVYEDPKDIEDRLSRIFEAEKFTQENKFHKAIEVFPNYPGAWMSNYEMNRQRLHNEGWEVIHDYGKRAIEACPESNELHGWLADICMRYDKFELAIDYLEEALKRKPEAPPYLMSWSQCYRQMGLKSDDPVFKVRCFEESRAVMRHMERVSMQTMTEALNWKYNDNAQIPSKFELKEG